MPLGEEPMVGDTTSAQGPSRLPRFPWRGLNRGSGREGQSFQVPCSTLVERSVGRVTGVPYRPPFGGSDIFGVA